MPGNVRELRNVVETRRPIAGAMWGSRLIMCSLIPLNRLEAVAHSRQKNETGER